MDFFVLAVRVFLFVFPPLFLHCNFYSVNFVLAVIFAVLVRECLVKHSCTSSTFFIAILNGTFFFLGELVDALAEVYPIKNEIMIIVVSCM